MISTDHSHPTIENWLSRYLYDCSLVSIKAKDNFNIIETDFSWAMIYGVLHSFNKMDIRTYIDYCYNTMKNPSQMSKTIVHICNAHMLHTVARRIGKKLNSLDGKIKTLILRSFCLLQMSKSLEEADTLYKNIYLILNCKTLGDDVEKFIKTLENTISIVQVTIDTDPTDNEVKLDSIEDKYIF